LTVKLIAEFCQNHNGDPEILARMVEAAAQHGATHAKVQNIYVRSLAFRPEFENGIEIDGKVHAIRRPYKPEYDRLTKLELSDKTVRKFVQLCHDNGVIPLTTCFARCDIDEIVDQGFREIKVASYDCASFALLRDLKERFERIYVSTGATFEDEIAYAAGILRGKDFTMLHCVTIYPTPLEALNLNAMGRLKAYSRSIGFSDHSSVAKTGTTASKAAIYKGATVVERHFSILPETETRDGPVSINGAQLAELAAFAARSPAEQLLELEARHPGWQTCLGSNTHALGDAELLNRAYYRGRFASPVSDTTDRTRMVYNWEEVAVK
jgi:N,N'-diacetyllegionaminate synthase